PEDVRFGTPTARVTPENERLLHQEIEAWSHHLTSDEILEKVMADPGPGVVVFGRVDSPLEVLTRDNWWERGCFQRFSDPVYGELILQMPAWRMTGTPPRVRWACRPPGFHNREVYQKYLGWGSAYVAALRSRGII
ncbi:MAG: CoA transferase, partial [Candidatus Methylomirabilaceae bacterium]